MVVGDLGKHPTMPPQSFQWKIHRRCNLLLCAGWSIGSIRGLGWEVSVVRCLLIQSWMTMWTYGMCRSVWSVWLLTYQGALVMVRRSLDWYLCIIAILDIFRDKGLFGGRLLWFWGSLFDSLVLPQLDIVRPDYNVRGIIHTSNSSPHVIEPEVSLPCS